ncbi:hypothetical protein Bca101_043566 [Brassica carinata]
MEQFPVTTLPEEIQASVAERVGANSVADLYRLGATCKSMKELTDRAGFYAALDVFTFPSHLQMSDGVMQACYANGNPSILFLKGVQVFYTFDLQDEGLALIKRAADAGFERALNTYAMTHKVFWNNEEHLSGFTRESVERIDKNVRSLDWGCGRSHTDAFLTKKYEFMSKVIPLFYNCKCTPLVERDWDLRHIEDSKGKNLCYLCFWIKELGLFYRDFKPMITRPW